MASAFIDANSGSTEAFENYPAQPHRTHQSPPTIAQHTMHESKHTIESLGASDMVAEQREALASTYVPGSEAEKKFLRKIDMRIVVSRLSTGGAISGDVRLTHSHASGDCTPSRISTARTLEMPRRAALRRTLR